MFKELFEAIKIKAKDVKELAGLIDQANKKISSDSDYKKFFKELDKKGLDKVLVNAIDSSMGETVSRIQSNLISALTTAYQREGTEPPAAIQAAEKAVSSATRKL